MRLAFIILFAALLFTQEASAQAPLNTALKVRSLSAEQAKEELPVHLRATVHFIESPGTIFVQDETAGTFFRTKSPLGDLREGDVVEVDGTTFPGLFLPGINTEHFRIVSPGDLPKAQPASFDDLLSARYHYQHVSVEGIVRSVVTSDESHSVLRLAMGSRVLEVRVGAAAAEHESLVDARVRITGLAAGTINDLRQLVQPYLRIANWSSIETLEAGRELNQVPQVTTASLLQFSASGETGHRVRVEGIVTAAFAEEFVFIRDDEASMAVRLDQPREIDIGTHLIVIGFPIMDRFTPTLADARPLSIITDALPQPTSVTRKELLKHGHDGDLVTLCCTVTDLYRGTEGQTLKLIDDDGQSLTASLRNGDALSVDLGSEVQLTGIARVESVSGKGFNAKPEAFSLWLRSAKDLRVLQAPSGLTIERLLTALGLLALIVLAATVWIMLLRRQVSALRLRIRHEAALEERQRIAREFHDTLEQELTGLSLRLDAAATRPLEDKAKSLLESSRGLVSRIQAEARNLVADLREDASTVELGTSLQTLAHHQAPNGPTMTVEIAGPLPSLPSSVVHDLRMIAQEAVTNALKHAQAQHIILRLCADEDAITLSIIDDGRGFNPQQESQGKAGHFGCMGIRERCRKIGAAVEWKSAPGKGTTVECRLRQ